jgi:hypothetical protein
MLKQIAQVLTIALVFAALDNCGGNGGVIDDPFNTKGVATTTLVSLAPASVPVGSPAFTLIIDGTGFVDGGTVSWAGKDIGPYTFVSASQVTILIPAILVSVQGPVSIVVNDPGATTKAGGFLKFDVTPFVDSGCVLYGTYDFFFTGFDSTGAMTTGGTFGVSANGAVNGEVDYKNRSDTRAAQPITGGKCTNGTVPNTGTLTVTTASGTSTYSFATQPAVPPQVQSDRGRMAESGDTNGVSGTGRFVFIHPGTISGDYVIALVGADLNGHRMGVVGRYTVSDSATGVLSGGLADINDNGTITSSAALTGSISAPDAFSRSTATMVIGSQTFHVAIYALRAEAQFAMDVDPVGSGAVLAGFVDQQLNAGHLGNANLGSSFVFSSWGVIPGSPEQSDTRIGVSSAAAPPSGTFNLEMDAVTGATNEVDQTVPVTYSVATTGRGTMSYTLGKPYNYVMYLYDSNAGFTLQTDTAGTVQFGFFEAQIANTAFNNTYIDGTFASAGWFNPVPTSPIVAAQYLFNNGNISASTAAGALTGSYSVSASGRGSGTVSLPILGSTNIVFYIVENDSLAVMGADPLAGHGNTINYMHQ